MKRNIIIGSVVLIAIIVGLFIFNKNPSSQVARPPLTQGNTDAPLQQATPSFAGKPETTLVGVNVCLPHKNTSGPQTMECAFGLQTDTNEYYAMDMTNAPNQDPIMSTTGTKIKVTGYVTPIEEMSADFWTKYNIKGIVSVTKVEQMK